MPCPADPSLAWHRPSPPLLHLVLSVLTPFAGSPDKAKALPKQCCNPHCRTFARVPPNRTADKIKALSKQFGKWHGISSLINLTTLIVGEWVVLCAA